MVCVGGGPRHHDDASLDTSESRWCDSDGGNGGVVVVIVKGWTNLGGTRVRVQGVRVRVRIFIPLKNPDPW